MGTIEGCNQRYCRQEVISAFNAYSAGLAKGDPHLNLSLAKRQLIFNKTRAGVWLATGIEPVDTQHAIPDSYTGDGSFLITVLLKRGAFFTQKEYIPLY